MSAKAPLSPWLLWAATLLAAALALVGVAFIAPHVPVPPLLAAVLSFACVGAEVVVVAWRVPLAGPRGLVLTLPFMGLLALAATWSSAPSWLGAMLVTIGLLGTGTLVGATVGDAIQHAGYLLVVAVVSTLVDVFSVLHPRGPTAQLVQIEAAVNILVLPWPMLGSSEILPVLGVGDVAFAGIYMAATRRHGLSVRRSALGLAIGLVLTLGALLVFQVAVPALPFLGVGVLCCQPEARRLPHEDRRTALVGVGVLLVLFAVAFALR
ncbi:MAG: hypothetical protein AB8I08_16570 [Sandaracinaceae bacterium]